MNKLLLLLLPITFAGCCWRIRKKPQPVVETPIQHVHHIIGLTELIQAIAQSKTAQEIEASLITEKDKLIKQAETKTIQFVEREGVHLIEEYVASKI
jgi:hypothetical protein